MSSIRRQLRCIFKICISSDQFVKIVWNEISLTFIRLQQPPSELWTVNCERLSRVIAGEWAGPADTPPYRWMGGSGWHAPFPGAGGMSWRGCRAGTIFKLSQICTLGLFLNTSIEGNRTRWNKSNVFTFKRYHMNFTKHIKHPTELDKCCWH